MKYDYNIAIDLEWTHVFASDKPKGLYEEIIEVGAVKLGPDGKEMDTFSEFVKPTYAEGVTRRVCRITGIRNKDLAKAKPLEEVLRDLMAWIGNGHVRMITWDSTDRTQIELECEVKGISVALPTRWLDLQKLYPKLMGTSRRQVALGEAADWCGLTFEKRHRAMHDARATGQIFRMAATGECVQQRHALECSINHDGHEISCKASIADLYGTALTELFASLSNQETMAYV